MNYLNKLRMAAGIPINGADEKVTKPETITEMSYEDEEMSGEDMRRIKKQVTKTMFELEAEADKQKDRGQKAMYMGDAADYENVFKAMSDGNQKKARKLFNAMDTAARDAAFDKGPKNTKGLLASYLGIELNENCGSPHSEDEEAAAAEDTERVSYTKGQMVMYKGERYCVEVPDAQSDFVGIIPDELKDASDDKRNSAVDLVHSTNLSKPEDEEVAVDPDMAPEAGETEITLSFEGEESKECKVCGKDIASDKFEEHKASCEAVKEEAVDATVWDAGEEDKDESPESGNDDERKINVPAEVKTALKKEIDELNKGAAEFKTRDEARADFYSDTAAALEDVLDHLNKGTVDEMKKAQVLASSLMGPMVQRIPDVAYKFIVRGGEPQSLSKLFHEVKMKNQGE